MDSKVSPNALPQGPHPAIAAVLLVAGLCLMLTYGFYLLDNVPDSEARQMKYATRLAGGLLVWIAGCAVLARRRLASAWLGAVCGLFPPIGLVVLLILTRNAKEKRLRELEAEFRLDHRRRARHIRPLY